MKSVKAGGDRQALHERLRVHSHAAAAHVKLEGGKTDLLERIKADPAFPLGADEIDAVLDPALYVGRAPEQVDEFVSSVIDPILARYPDANLVGELNV